MWATPNRCSSSMMSEAEVLELDVLLEQAVRADDDVDAAVRQPFSTICVCSCVGAEAGEDVDRDGEGGEALGERLIVLLGEDRCRHEDGDLLAVHHGLERRRGWRLRSCRSRRRRRSGRSIGRGASMSCLTAVMAASWSGVST